MDEFDFGEKCIVCGEFTQYCVGGHGEPCPDCPGYSQPEGGEWHSLDCVLADHKPQPKLVANYGLILFSTFDTSGMYLPGFKFIEPGQVDIYAGAEGHGYIIDSPDWQAEIDRLAEEPDPYPDLVTNGHGGWSRA